MISLFKHIFTYIVTVFVVTMFFSCKGNLGDIQKLNLTSNAPKGIANDFNLVYTDSTKVKAIVSGPVYNDYANLEFPYQEFPDGVKVDFFDDQNNKTVVTANYGVIYSTTNLIELVGDVVIETHEGKKLEAPQLYWDYKNEWIFTEKNYTFTSEDLNMEGVGIDFNKSFTKVNSHKNTGNALVKE
ncbi:LPS export ABC transporter periplasmic protein LptC [Abyssalbus ytuae]|uniref:LPS export ABC transporter periplasmic protein LptC n=1 Tax=Abyssalbus ytuae TaxID=2926907 RepID=A0A9E7D0U2_9FLAO|nr:LPS export ABC transporter periplasmic protein LptC [Abyssalbus ytuae]UOB18730.1 LPS export ABC transporter periplasmic protein LptC [Abyssalbus ytuae]